MHRLITMHARPGHTYIQTDGQTDQHHGNSATIRSNERISHAKNRRSSTKLHTETQNTLQYTGTLTNY